MDDEIRGTEEDPQYARGVPGPHGKFTEQVKFYVDETAFMDLLKFCNARDMTPSQLMRAAAYCLLYGETPEQSLAERQREALAPLDGLVGTR